MEELLGGLGMQALSFGTSMVGSWVSGYVQKNHTKIPNDTIAQNNAAVWGGGWGAATQDATVGLSGAAGAMAASLTKSLFGKIFNRG
jgi:hypothetical protein